MFIAAFLIIAGLFWLRFVDQRRRITLLGRHLNPFRIEPLMQRLNDAYMRALSESDTARQQQIWQLQHADEHTLASQVEQLASKLSAEPAGQTRISRIPLPYADRWWPGSSFDLREAMRLHASGIQRTVDNAEQRPPRERAFTLLAELYLMQHTCHWFCRSRAIASARVLAHHKTAYDQLLASVTPATRQAYGRLVGLKA